MIIELASSKKQKRRSVLSFFFLRALSNEISEENRRYTSAACRTLHLPNSAIKFLMRGAREETRFADRPYGRRIERIAVLCEVVNMLYLA